MAKEKLIVDFWDVGQGDCSVIRLPDNSLVVIDVGPRSSPLIDWLNEKPHDIHTIVITHNDADHAGALPSLVNLPNQRIQRVFMLSDRRKDIQAFRTIFQAVRTEEKKGRLEVIGLDKTREIWRNPEGTLEIKIVFPSFSENIEANKPNQTSAIVCLFQRQKAVMVWPGDAPMRVVAEKLRGATPSILVGPHHGGPVDRKQSEFPAWARAITPERLFVSVGTKQNPNNNHPSPEYLELRRAHGCQVMCSQLTKLCDNEHVNKGSPVMQTAFLLGLRPPRKGVSCRGCFRVVVTESSITPDAFDAPHRTRVQALRRPKCVSASELP